MGRISFFSGVRFFFAQGWGFLQSIFAILLVGISTPLFSGQGAFAMRAEGGIGVCMSIVCWFPLTFPWVQGYETSGRSSDICAVVAAGVT